MTDHAWLIIITTGFFLLAMGLIVVIGLLIYSIVEMRKMAGALHTTIRSAEELLNPVLLEAEQCLRGVRKIADDVSAVTGTARDIAEASNEILINMKAFSGLIKDLREGVSLRVLGIRKGVRTALNVLINQMKERREYHER
jgi:hypothetical protein